MQNTDTTKYIIRSKINADGVIERPDIVGAIFGQTEGLLGADLDLRDLQKTGRIGRIEVMVTAKGGKTRGNIFVPSSLDKVETSILAASLETIDRVGPCTAKIEVFQIEDVRAVKRKRIIDRAKLIFTKMFDDSVPESQELAEEVRQSVRIDEMTYYGKSRIPCGPNVINSDAIIIVEGRADILTLLRYGIKNTICVGGTNVPPEVAELTKKKTVTAFTDGDRGGELIIRELLQVADIDFVSRAPDGKCVEDLVQKEIIRALRRKIPVEQIIEKYGIKEAEGPKAAPVGRFSSRKKLGFSSQEAGTGVGVGGGNTPRVVEKKLHKRIKVHRLPKKSGIGPEAEEVPVHARETVEVVHAKAPFKPRVEVKRPSVVPVRAARRVHPPVDKPPIRKPVYKEAIKPVPERLVSPESVRFKPHTEALKGTLSARILDQEDNVIEEIAVRDLASKLKTYRDNVDSVVFDGVITQRLVDIASSNDIKKLVGVKLGNLAKIPISLEVLTASML